MQSKPLIHQSYLGKDLFILPVLFKVHSSPEALTSFVISHFPSYFFLREELFSSYRSPHAVHSVGATNLWHIAPSFKTHRYQRAMVGIKH